MRKINKIILHCSATIAGKDYRAKDIKKWHLQRGFSDIGYHYIIDLNGIVEKGRDISVIGAHCKGHNSDSIGICYVGGLDFCNRPTDTRTEYQYKALLALVGELRETYGNIPVYGHNYFDKVKACPCISQDEIDREFNKII